MTVPDHAALDLGEEPPLPAGRSGPPDRREISARWLSGTFLTGVTSSVLMGVALFAALDGREIAASIVRPSTPAENSADGGQAAKSERVFPSRTLAGTSDVRRLEVATLSQEGETNVVRALPFAQISMALAAGHTPTRSYPPFDPLEVFAEPQEIAEAADMAQIYGAMVESEVSLQTRDFPLKTASFDMQSDLTAAEVEAVVRNTGAILTDGDIEVAALHYVNPQRFGESLATTVLTDYGVRVVPENVSVSVQDDAQEDWVEFAEDIIPVRAPARPVAVLGEAGYSDGNAERVAEAIGKLVDGKDLSAGTVLRLGLEIAGERQHIVRASIYDGAKHRFTIALDDSGRFVPGDEPGPNPAVSIAAQGTIPFVGARDDLPTVYDAVYRAGLSYGLSHDMVRRVIRLLAAEVDYQARIAPTDRIEVFFSHPDAENRATEASELLYVEATFGSTTRTFYRFQMADGTQDFFDKEGRSARQFLLRNPVPNGRFTSGFGNRRHPILGYVRAHTGVDWAAPRGTPIIASGNGVVVKAGWAGGYGRQTIIRHANGYKTSYNHQHAIAEGIAPGRKVRQGQIIGYVGTTGQSTGNHLHYELIVNGTKVDPMRVRLPNNRTLEGEELEKFEYERQRIDALLNDEPVPPLRMASN